MTISPVAGDVIGGCYASGELKNGEEAGAKIEAESALVAHPAGHFPSH